jgi:hypothetical protein
MTTDVLPGSGYDRSTRYDTLAAFAEAILKQQEAKRDFVVDGRAMSFRPDDDTNEMILAWDAPSEIEGIAGGVEAMPLRDHAHGQMAAKTGIPKRYYDRMREEATSLLSTNVEYWLRDEPKRHMIRTIDGRVRALLSDRYRRLDHADLMEQAVLPSLGEIDGLTFQVASLTDEKLHLNVILPRLYAEIAVGDVVQAGVQITNSEVGGGRLRVLPRIWRLVCLNGLLIPAEGMSQYHVGRRIEDETYEIFADDTLAADDHAFFLKVRDAVRASLDQARFEQIVASLRETTEGPKVADPVAASEVLANSYDLTKEEGRSVLLRLAQGGDFSRWGMVNAVTAAAKSADTFERQAEMELVGGALVAATPREWTKIAAATAA